MGEAVDALVDSSEFGHSLSEACWSVIDPKGSHN
jgi:hypothetical protein